MTGPKVVGTIPTEGGASSAATPNGKPSANTDRPTRALPTERIGFGKQLDLLRGYAALVAQGTAAPTNPAVANLVSLNRNTTILAHPFFLDIGLLTKAGDGYVPAPEVVAYGKAFSWNQETAAQRLAPVLRRSWFAQELLPRLAMGTLDEIRAIQLLGEAASAGPRFEGQIKTLLQYLTVAGVIRREGDTIREGTSVYEPEGEMANPRTDTTTQTAKEIVPTKESPRTPAISTAFSQVPEGVLRIAVDVNVDLREFSTWRPDRISAFWAGIAQVLAAKAAVEQGSGV